MKIDRIVQNFSAADAAGANRQATSAPSKKWIETSVNRIVSQLPRVARNKISRICSCNGAKNAMLTCVFVGASEIRRLNREFRHKDKPTDVLSFAPTEAGSLGELVFCLEVIERQAREHGLSSRDELTYMLIHGILHLLGYEHEKSDKAARLMYRLQDRIFETITAPNRPQSTARGKSNVHRHRTHRRKK